MEQTFNALPFLVGPIFFLLIAAAYGKTGNSGIKNIRIEKKDENLEQ